MRCARKPHLRALGPVAQAVLDRRAYYNGSPMARISSRTRFAPLERAFGGGRSPLLDSLAPLSVLYEDLRIETFAIAADEQELKRLDELGSKYRVNYFLRRSIATLLEFEGVLHKLSKTPQYKAARRNTDKDLIRKVEDAIRFFQEHHKLLKSLRNDIGGHFSDEAAAFATRHAEPDTIAKLEITFHPSGKGGGAKLHYAGEIAATAFTRSLPGSKPLAEEIKGVICTIREAYAQATGAMHALVVAFLWDRF